MEKSLTEWLEDNDLNKVEESSLNCPNQVLKESILFTNESVKTPGDIITNSVSEGSALRGFFMQNIKKRCS